MSDEEVKQTPQSVKATADAFTDALTSRSAPIALPMYNTWQLAHLWYVFAALETKTLKLHAQWMPTETEEEHKATKAKATAFLKKIQDEITHMYD